MASYPLGTKVKAWGRFYDSDSALADPTAVYAVIKYPDSKYVAHTVGSDIVKDGTGEYYVYISTTKPGRHYVRWYSTGSYQAAQEGSFMVEKAVARE